MTSNNIASAPMHPRVDELINLLRLEPHPEGGLFRRIYRSQLMVTPSDSRGPRVALSVIYFLLVQGGGESVASGHLGRGVALVRGAIHSSSLRRLPIPASLGLLFLVLSPVLPRRNSSFLLATGRPHEQAVPTHWSGVLWGRALSTPISTCSRHYQSTETAPHTSVAA